MSMLVGDNDMRRILTEAYYGRAKEFDIIEREIDKIREQLKEDANDTSSWESVAINSSDSVNIINKTFKKIFGVKDFFITFYTSTPFGGYRISYNAFTMPKSFTIVHRDWKMGMRAHPKHLLINVQIDKLFLISDKFTTKEIVAMILHEIGHNFDASIFTFLGRAMGLFFNPVFTPGILAALTLALDTIGIQQLIAKINNGIEHLVEAIPGLSKLLTNVTSTITSFNMILGSVIFPSKILSNITGYFESILSGHGIFGYVGEKYSDSFATAYGYGNSISSALIKLEKRDGLKIIEDIRNMPGLGVAYNFSETLARALTLPLDPHPDTAVRVLSQLKKMERDIDDPTLPAPLRKELSIQIKEQKKIIEEFTDVSKMNEYGMIYSAMWNKMMIETFDGKLDPRELIEAVARHEE